MNLFRLRPEKLVAIVVLVLIAVVFLRVSASNPPGFFQDESANSYNAYTLSTTGKDEYGARLPLFIRSFNDYKSPLYVYLLAGVYEVTGLSKTAARELSAVFGLAAILVLYALALAITRKQTLAIAFAAIVGLGPWLFENSRVAFDLSLLPFLLALFLLVVYRASSGVWRLRHSVTIGLLLALIAYSYQVGRVLAPLLAIGLVLCWFRQGWRRLGAVWAAFLAGIAPIGVWTLAHPGDLGARYHATTWLQAGMSPWEICRQFLVHYAKNMNLWAWAVRGGVDPEDHVQGAGSLFFVVVALALAGTGIVLLRRRSDPWWWFVLFGVLASPVAASFVYESLSDRRMIALPVFLPLLAIPALEWIASLPHPRARAAIAVAVIAAFAVEAVHWQIVYHRNGPGRLATFDAQAPSIVDDAFRHAGTVYAFRFDHPQYIDLLLYSALAGRSRSSTVILDSAERPPVGAVFIGRPAECPQCPRLATKDNFETYRYKPAPPGVVRTHFQLNSPLLPVGSPLQFLVEVDNTGSKPADHIVLTVRLPGSLRLGAPPYHQRGSCSIHSNGVWYEPTGSTTITCNMGYFPKKSSTTIRYQVVVARGGPQTMTARISSDQLDVNPVGASSAFTVDLSPPAYARSSPAR
jgi:Domain of unknown function DUF11